MPQESVTLLVLTHLEALEVAAEVSPTETLRSGKFTQHGHFSVQHIIVLPN
ncbi:hypothetical protein FRB90_004576 [Tulasnella sp. 427]|nr:hypothetical protein FRB90_004576 [Tulasnella sp. 427]